MSDPTTPSDPNPILGLLLAGGVVFLMYELFYSGKQQSLPYAPASSGTAAVRPSRRASSPETQFVVFDDYDGSEHPAGSFAAAKALAKKLNRQHHEKTVVGRKSDNVSVYAVYSDGSAGTGNKGRWYSPSQP